MLFRLTLSAVAVATAMAQFPNPTITLNNGVVMPQMSLGSWQVLVTSGRGAIAPRALWAQLRLPGGSVWFLRGADVRTVCERGLFPRACVRGATRPFARGGA